MKKRRRSAALKSTGRQPSDKAARKPAARAATSSRRRSAKTARSQPIAAVPVTAEELRLLQRELERRIKGPQARGRAVRTRKRGAAPPRWNPDPEDVQKSVAQLVLTIVEFLRKLMERQAIRRMEARTLTPAEVEAVGAALMLLEQTVREIGSRFGLLPEDLNLDLGAIKLM